MKTALKVTVVAIVAILVLLLLWAVVQYSIIPALSEGWQVLLVWTGAVVLWIVSVISGIAQFTGYNLRELVSSSRERRSSSFVSKSPVDILINDIQKDLYGDDNKLPYVLTLCIDLCHHLDLPRDYVEWLKRELSGFGNREELAKVLGGGDYKFDEWMKTWARHRLVKTYVKYRYISAETGMPVIDRLPYEDIFIGQSLAQIVDMKRAGSADHSTGEFAVSMAELSKDKLEEFKAFITSSEMHMQVPDDLQVFFTAGPLTQLLSGVREHVLSLLGDARAQSKLKRLASSAALD